MTNNSTAKAQDPYQLARSNQNGNSKGRATGRGDAGPASKRIVVGYGFWIFLLSDIIMFAAFFAAYSVLAQATAGGPGPHELFDRGSLALETAVLLASSFTCGLAGLASESESRIGIQASFFLTGLLGALFLYLELREFWDLISQGAGPDRSAFLSSFFALVGCHGLHVALGILWIGTMMAQVQIKGFREDIKRRIMCLNLFWHALDIVWVAIFSIVYLMSIAP